MSEQEQAIDVQANGQAIEAKAGHGTLSEALVAAQSELPPIEADQTNPHFKSKFVSLGALISKVRPVLNRHGVALKQAPCLDSEGRFVLRTTFTHASGESDMFDSPLAPTKHDPQGQGSAITYMRRYSLAAALAIADQEDDDGNVASAQANGAAAQPVVPVVRLTPERTDRIMDGFKVLGLNWGELGLLLGSCNIDGLTSNTIEAVRERIAGLGEVEANALEAEIEKRVAAGEQDGAATQPDQVPTGEQEGGEPDGE